LIRKARICHVTKATGVAGSEKHLLTLLTGLDKAKYQVTLVLLVERDKPLDDYVQRFEERGIQVKRVLIRGDIDPLLVWRLYRLLREGNHDLVHTHLIHADLYGTLAAKLAGAPIIVSTKHNDNAFRRHPFYALLDRLASKFADKIIVISDHLKRFFVEIERLDPRKMTRIYYGLDAGWVEGQSSKTARPISIQEELGIPPDTPLAGIIARLNPQKGHTYLVTAFAKVVDSLPEARLLIVGDGNLREDLERQTKELRITRRVTFTGWRDDIPRIMAALNLLILPSLWEGFGLVLLEAMVMGKPIVASRVSAIPEIVVDGVTGLLVPPRDPEAMAKAIIALLQDKEQAEAMGLTGRERVERSFSVEMMVQQAEALYEALIREKIGLEWAEGEGRQPAENRF
jgi:glycosyltransferase involved in cell wall biosynthesis